MVNRGKKDRLTVTYLLAWHYTETKYVSLRITFLKTLKPRLLKPFSSPG